jgi:hypothetical protein
MAMLRTVSGAVACVLMLACGSSTPESPLILGGAEGAVLGPRTLTASQQRALMNVIESSGEPCEAVMQTYLRDADAAGSGIGQETWDVRCNVGTYAVVITDDGTPASVRRCGGRYAEVPCFQRDRGPRREADSAPPLNPELGKLLEPMTAKDAKVD